MFRVFSRGDLFGFSWIVGQNGSWFFLDHLRLRDAFDLDFPLSGLLVFNRNLILNKGGHSLSVIQHYSTNKWKPSILGGKTRANEVNA